MVYCAPVVQISMSVQSTMAIVTIYAITLEAISHVAVDLATDCVVMADHAQVRKINPTNQQAHVLYCHSRPK